MRNHVVSVAAVGVLAVGAAIAFQGLQRVTVESRDGNRAYQRVNTRGGVRLVRTLRGRCVENRTWGVDSRGIWTDDGCSAIFEVGDNGRPARPGRPGRPGNGNGNGGWNGGNNGNGNGGWNGGGWNSGNDRPSDTGGWNGGNNGGNWTSGGNIDRRRVVSLLSTGRGRTTQRLEGAIAVRLLRQRSDAACRAGKTWGWDRNELWVDKGCRADFEVVERQRPGDTNDGGWWGGDRDRRVTLRSDGNRYRELLVANRGVRLIRTLSGRCDQGRSWGNDRDKVWVDEGCSAEFQITRR